MLDTGARSCVSSGATAGEALCLNAYDKPSLHMLFLTSAFTKQKVRAMAGTREEKQHRLCHSGIHRRPSSYIYHWPTKGERKIHVTVSEDMLISIDGFFPAQAEGSDSENKMKEAPVDGFDS